MMTAVSWRVGLERQARVVGKITTIKAIGPYIQGATCRAASRPNKKRTTPVESPATRHHPPRLRARRRKMRRLARAMVRSIEGAVGMSVGLAPGRVRSLLDHRPRENEVPNGAWQAADDQRKTARRGCMREISYNEGRRSRSILND